MPRTRDNTVLREPIEVAISRIIDERAEMIANLKRAEETHKGDWVYCANCGKPTLKKNYQTKFCSNIITSGKGNKNCKDMFHNQIKGYDYRLRQMREMR